MWITSSLTIAFGYVSSVAGQGSIIDVAVRTQNEFNPLAAALTSADLVEALQGDGPFSKCRFYE